MAIANPTTFVVMIVSKGYKMAKLRSKETATKLNTEAIKEPTWAEWKNLHNAAPINVPNHPLQMKKNLRI